MLTCAQHFENFDKDALVVMSDQAQIIGNRFIDSCAAKDPVIAEAAHRDAIQLIPFAHTMPREQFAAGTLFGVAVLGNYIESTGKLQCVFGSDGLFRYLKVIGNVIQTQGQHYISISGLLSGWIEGNIKPDGSHCPIRLEPLRIGGNLGEGCVRILGFAEDEYAYRPVDDLVDYKTLASGAVLDLRTKPLLNKDTYLVNFRLDEFRAAAQKLPEMPDINEHMRALKQLALRHGDLYGT